MKLGSRLSFITWNRS